ncbi:MAG: transposase [Thermales bacterium]|nr:transposase [Thermales bacterium]
MRYNLPKVKNQWNKKYTSRQLVDGILYVLVNGCTWRNLPKDLPKWSSCYKYFRKLRVLGVLESILYRLNQILLDSSSQSLKLDYQHILVIDSQSVRATNMTQKLQKRSRWT